MRVEETVYNTLLPAVEQGSEVFYLLVKRGSLTMEPEITPTGLRVMGYTFDHAPYLELKAGEEYIVLISSQPREVGEQGTCKITFWSVTPEIKPEDRGLLQASFEDDMQRDWGEVKIVYNDGSTVIVENLTTGIQTPLNYGVGYTGGNITNTLN